MFCKEWMELKLAKMALIYPVERILIKKGKVARVLIIFILIILGVLNQSKCFKSVEYDAWKLKVKLFIVQFFNQSLFSDVFL